MRLLVCLDCKSIEELPDFEGKPEDDVLLEHLLNNNHAGATPEPHLGNLIGVEDRHWKDKTKRDEILRQIKEGTRGIAELDADFYDTKNTFQEDAMRCFKAHQRPQDGCPDYKDESKRLGNPMKDSPQKVYICDFCVVKSTVQQKVFEKRGMYDN